MRKIVFTLFTVSCLLTTGCIGFSGPNDLRFAVSRSSGWHLKKETGINVGPLMIGTARLLGGQQASLLKGLWAVDVGEYDIRKSKDRDAIPGLGELELPGWEPFVTVHEPGSETVLLVRAHRDAVKGMIVLAREKETLTIVRIRGRLDHLVRQGLRLAMGRQNDWLRAIRAGSTRPESSTSNARKAASISKAG